MEKRKKNMLTDVQVVSDWFVYGTDQLISDFDVKKFIITKFDAFVLIWIVITNNLWPTKEPVTSILSHGAEV